MTNTLEIKRERERQTDTHTHTRYLVLEVGAFERLMGPCMEIMKRNIETYQDQLINIFGSEKNITDLR